MKTSTRPNQAVSVRDFLESPAWSRSKAILPLAVGLDNSGVPVIVDLAEVGHLVVIGRSRPTVIDFVSASSTSLLSSRKPIEVGLILIDTGQPKMSAITNDSHLILPVASDIAPAGMTLAWLIDEMRRRYSLFSRSGVRAIEDFNNRTIPEGDGETCESPARIPYLVLVVSEFADLMTATPVEFETAIARLAHLSPAAGIHLVLATADPSEIMLSSAMKTNVSSHIFIGEGIGQKAHWVNAKHSCSLVLTTDSGTTSLIQRVSC